MAIKTSIGTPTANSYVSVASADEYFAARENVTAWDTIASSTSSTTAVRTRKENVLIMSTREIDKNLMFFGSKYNQGVRGDSEYQNLEFPRTTDFDANGDAYILDEVKYATYEQALWIMERQGNRRTADSPQQLKETMGKFSIQYLEGLYSRWGYWVDG
jgi:hypothetical protein